MTSRRQWVATVKAAPFPASQRPMKATLLSLPDLMTPDGVVERWRDELLAMTGLPGRTLDRHMQRAAEDGWLVHEVHGGRGRRARFLAALPSMNSSPSVASYEPNSSPSTRGLPGRVARHPVAKKKNYSASESEHLAVDSYRHGRYDHDGDRDPRPDVAEETSSSYEGVTATPLPPSVDSPDAQGVRESGTETARERVARAAGPIPWPIPTDDELARRAAAVRECQARQAERRRQEAAR